MKAHVTCASAEDSKFVAAPASSLHRRQLFHQSVHVHGCLQSTDHIRLVMIELSCKFSWPVYSICRRSGEVLPSQLGNSYTTPLMSTLHKATQTLLSRTLLSWVSVHVCYVPTCNFYGYFYTVVAYSFALYIGQIWEDPPTLTSNGLRLWRRAER